MALSNWSGERSGVPAFVTLEPCSFHGRTPSSALALINGCVEKVFVAMLDPDPRNSGAGIKMVQDAGIILVVGLLTDEAVNDLAEFLVNKESGRHYRVDRSYRVEMTEPPWRHAP